MGKGKLIKRLHGHEICLNSDGKTFDVYEGGALVKSFTNPADADRFVSARHKERLARKEKKEAQEAEQEEALRKVRLSLISDSNEREAEIDAEDIEPEPSP